MLVGDMLCRLNKVCSHGLEPELHVSISCLARFVCLVLPSVAVPQPSWHLAHTALNPLPVPVLTQQIPSLYPPSMLAHDEQVQPSGSTTPPPAIETDFLKHAHGPPPNPLAPACVRSQYRLSWAHSGLIHLSAVFWF